MAARATATETEPRTLMAMSGSQQRGGVKLAHFSDTHLGYEAYRALTPRGDNQRGFDIVDAFRQTVDGILEWDPDIIIHAGDVTDRPKVDFRYLLFIQQQLERLTVRKDGSRRPVVVIAGNHDAPRSRKEVCSLELFRNIPGVYIVTQGYAAIDLGEVMVHAVPHDSLKGVDFSEVRPVAGKINVFTSHGVAEDSELFLRAIGREFPIPGEVLRRDWEYGALGHWHKRGPVSVGGITMSRIWYAGSTENISFRDLRDDRGMRRGWLAVTLRQGEDPVVEERDVKIRRMFRLPGIDGTGMGPDEITASLIEAIRKADIAGAVVSQDVTGVSRDIWSLCDITEVRRWAKGALHYQINYRPLRRSQETKSDIPEGTSGLGQIDDWLKGIVADLVPEEQRGVVMERSLKFLAEARGEVAGVVAGDGGETADTAPAASDLDAQEDAA